MDCASSICTHHTFSTLLGPTCPLPSAQPTGCLFFGKSFIDSVLLLFHTVHYSKMGTLVGDEHGTLYRGSDLLQEWIDTLKLKDTRTDGEWSHWLYANIHVDVALRFVNKHKGRPMDKRRPFTLFLLPSTHEMYDTFIQDVVWTDRGFRMVPNFRRDYMRTKRKVKFPIAVSYTFNAGMSKYIAKVECGQDEFGNLEIVEEALSTLMEDLKTSRH